MAKDDVGCVPMIVAGLLILLAIAFFQTCTEKSVKYAVDNGKEVVAGIVLILLVGGFIKLYLNHYDR